MGERRHTRKIAQFPFKDSQGATVRCCRRQGSDSKHPHGNHLSIAEFLGLDEFT